MTLCSTSPPCSPRVMSRLRLTRHVIMCVCVSSSVLCCVVCPRLSVSDHELRSPNSDGVNSASSRSDGGTVTVTVTAPLAPCFFSSFLSVICMYGHARDRSLLCITVCLHIYARIGIWLVSKLKRTQMHEMRRIRLYAQKQRCG